MRIYMIIVLGLIMVATIFSLQTIKAEKENEILKRQACEAYLEKEIQSAQIVEDILEEKIQALEKKCTCVPQILSNEDDILLAEKNNNTITFKGISNYSIGIERVGDTGSMYPAIRNWSYLLTTGNIGNLTGGDIIIFFEHFNNSDNIDWQIAHRIIRIEENSKNPNLTRYYTKGDNNKATDMGFRIREDITSKVIGVIY